jgi:hypothetical protein
MYVVFFFHIFWGHPIPWGAFKTLRAAKKMKKYAVVFLAQIRRRFFNVVFMKS